MSKDQAEITERISLAGIDPVGLLGPRDANLKLIQHSYKARISSRGDEIIVRGSPEDVESIVSLLLQLREEAEDGAVLTEREIGHAIARAHNQKREISDRGASVTLALKKMIKPKSRGQAEYLESIKDNDLVIAIGPAGTGKTYLAVAAAVAALNERQVERIILCRPAVEAGESLGFLPGDFKDKVDPYMRPLYDALYDLMSPEKVRRFLANDIIEIVPLAYMRGRTLNNSFVILDEAQNATRTQMKMFLTRLGFNSKAVVTGDVTQIDLARDDSSGLVHISEVLSGVEGITFIYLTERDVVRHHLVQRIIQAYQEHADDGGRGRGQPRETGPSD
jgi:phosphate starvation-inducible PhoH-like protein